MNKKQFYYQVFFYFVLWLILFNFAPALAVEKCIMCGMDACKSETKFTVQLEKGTKGIKAGKYSFCCLRCLIFFETRLKKKGKMGTIFVRDYNTVSEAYDSGEMFKAKQGFYLIESKLRPKESMVPFMLIFSSKKTAIKYKKIYGGKIYDWEKAYNYTKTYK